MLLVPAATGLGVVVVAAVLVWLVSLRLRDASIVDPLWAPGFLLVGAVYVAVSGPTVRGVLMLTAVALWAARLWWHLFRRNRAEGEDRRYARWRKEHGPAWWWVSLFKVFLLQALILWGVSAPLLGIAVGRTRLGAWDALGFAVFLAGWLTEAVADAQLRAFRRDPASRGQVMDGGLWRYSRHPNYFGNAVLWWGLYLVAVGAGAAWSVFGPVLMTVLLLRVSGVTLLEQDMAERRPGYADYVRRTSAFIPRPPGPAL